MFGSASNFSWQNPQQNPQQQQQTSAFGQPAGGFGTSAFGSTNTSTFGQNQPAQQPQANPMFGNLGTTPTNTGTSGFGAFGSSNTSQSNGANPMFGGAKPSTGFGAFGGGGGGTFGGGGGAFGQGTNTASGSGTTGLFGQTSSAAAPAAFGTSNSIFGGNKATTTFGATTTGTVLPVTTGSSNPPYAVHTEKDATSGNTVFHYQAISCMPAYSNTSHDELRLQDYTQGRKTASTFGSGAFGSTQPTNTGIFGAQASQQNPQPSTFGGATGNTGFGTFGTTNTTTTAPTSTGVFGGGAFGTNQQQPQQQQQQQQQQPQTQGFGTFGPTTQQPQQQQAGGIFGNGAFGSTTNKPAFSGFGNTTGTGALSGGFGQQNQQQQQAQPANGLFGNTTTAPANAGFGTFGNTGNKSIFGGNSTSTTQPPTTFGGFGPTQPQQSQQPQNQQNPQFGGSLFGNNQQQQQQPGTQQPTANTAFGGQTGGAGAGLFGGGGIFGNQQQQQAQPQAGTFSGSLFGPKPAQPAGNLFGGGFGQQSTNNTQQPSIFGNPLGQTNNQSTLGGGMLFGNKSATPAIGASATPGSNIFGATPNQAGGSFNVSASAPGAQGTLMASISQPIGADLPIFDLLPPGPRLVNLDGSQQKKKTGFFVDMPTRSSVPRFGYTPTNSRLRGFSTSSTVAPTNPTTNPFFASSALSSSRAEPFSLGRMNDKSTGVDAILGRSSSPSLGSGQRQSVKKVILDKKVEPSELFVKTGGSPGLRGGKVVFSPKLSVASREKDALGALAAPNGTAASPTPPARPQRTPNRFTAQSATQPVDGDAQNTADLEEGDYWVKPDLVALKRAGYDELSSFKGLIVGRVGYGEIEFLEPVDLTGLPKLGALLGDVIRFEEKECSVYPESDEVDKPPPGSGLNVPARLALSNCWAVDKSTREPIRDDTHPSAIKHLKRLKKIPNTHFESFNMEDGRWTFKVDHF